MSSTNSRTAFIKQLGQFDFMTLPVNRSEPKWAGWLLRGLLVLLNFLPVLVVLVVTATRDSDDHVCVFRPGYRGYVDCVQTEFLLKNDDYVLSRTLLGPITRLSYQPDSQCYEHDLKMEGLYRVLPRTEWLAARGGVKGETVKSIYWDYKSSHFRSADATENVVCEVDNFSFTADKFSFLLEVGFLILLLLYYVYSSFGFYENHTLQVISLVLNMEILGIILSLALCLLGFSIVYLFDKIFWNRQVNTIVLPQNVEEGS